MKNEILSDYKAILTEKIRIIFEGNDAYWLQYTTTT